MFKHIRTRNILLLIIIMSSLSCKKFLTTYSQSKAFIQNASDLKEVLIGDAYLRNTLDLDFLYSLDDDVQLGTFNTLNRHVLNIGFHFWLDDPWVNSDGVVTSIDRNFNNLYSKIVKINSILTNVDFLKDKGESVIELDGIAGESLFLRAYYYFMLVNQYGKPYSVSSANTDFGVPLKLKSGVEDNFAQRATTGQIYSQILSDLKEGEKLLINANVNSKIRANVTAVHALLSRVYLFMEDYDNAVLYADKVINNQQYQLLDLKHYNVATDFSTLRSPEIIFSIGGNNLPTIAGLQADEYFGSHYIPSEELLSLYTAYDLRKVAFFIQNSKGVFKFAKKKSINVSHDDASDFYLIRLAEVYLNKAEALALMNKGQDARDVLHSFLKYRFNESEIPVVHSEGEDLVNAIRNERRRELCVEAHRWFDLRRYAVNSVYPFMKRIQHRNISFTGLAYEVDGYYELGTYDEDPGTYIIPIANDEIEFNNGHLKNELRSHRVLKH